MSGSDTPLVVLKVGGNVTFEDGALRDLPALLADGQLGAVIVHGGGPSISRLMERLALPVTFHEGLRVTDEQALEVVTMVLRGQVSTALVAGLGRLGLRAVGLSGVDAGLVRAVPHPDSHLGLVGRVDAVRSDLLWALIRQGLVPCLAPLALDGAGQLRNLNADTLAGAVAAVLQARWTIFLTDVPGVLRRDGTLAERLTPDEVEGMIADGQISGGMIPKVRACLDALGQGAQAVYIADGRQPGAVASIVASGERRATMIADQWIEG